MKALFAAMIVCMSSLMTLGCAGGTRAADVGAGQYVWNRVVEKASFPEGYNYPVFVFGKWMVAMNNGAWLSTNGERWVKTELPDSGLMSAYQKYVQFNGAIYALGTMTGNYESMHLTSKIARTQDFKIWETVATHSNLPERVFYGAAVFEGKIWLAGGYDGHRYYNDVWSSPDAVHWTRVTENAGWSARGTKLVVFNGQLMLLGGGVIDGVANPNPGSDAEIWTSKNGKEWARLRTDAAGKLAGTPVVYDGRLWLIGANRNDGKFSNALWVSRDGARWQKRSAPWSPRGGVAVWESGGRLYMTGGKFSETVNGQIRFIYSNDVWVMDKETE